MRARQLANQIAGSILLSGTASPAQVSETLLVDLRDADWTTSILRELRASMASWGLDDRGGLFSTATYGDVGFLVANPDPASSKKTFVSVGNISNVLGPLYAKILGEDEPFRKRRLTGHVFEGQFEEMHISEIMTDVVRYLISYIISGKQSSCVPNLGSHPDLRSGTQHVSPTSTNSRYIRSRKRTQKKRVRGGRVL